MKKENRLKNPRAYRYGYRCSGKIYRRKRVQSRLERIAFALEHSKFLEYLDDTRKPKWLLLRHFAMGAAKGVGLTVGTALVIAAAIWILQYLINMNIPFLTERLVDFVQFVKQAATSVPAPNGSSATSYMNTLTETFETTVK